MANDLIEAIVWPNGGGAGTVLTLASQGPDGGPPTEGKWQRNVAGTGQVTVPADDPNVGLLVPGAMLGWRVNGTLMRFTVRIEHVHETDVTDGEDAAREVTASGYGLLTEWDDALLHPVNGYDRKPFDDRVYYDFTHPDFDDTSWGPTVYPILAPGDEDPAYPVVVQRHSLPMEQPDPYAQWVASQAEDVPTHSMPLGSMFFRRLEEIDGSGEAIALTYTSADDQFREYGGGVLWLKGEDDPGYSFVDTYRAPRRVTRGQALQRAIEVVAAERPFTTLNITALINSFFLVDSLDSILVDTTFLSQTGTPPFTSDGWLCIDNFADPTQRPGWTFGAMFGSAFVRASFGYGECVQWIFGFDGTVDSFGSPWDLTTEFDFPTCGQLNSDVLAKCTETHVDLVVYWDPTTGIRTLHAHNKGTAGYDKTAIELVTGDDSATPNITALETDLDASSVIDRLAYRHANGFSKVEQAPAAGFPRRSGFLKMGGTQDPTEAARVAQVNMANLSQPKTSLRVGQDTTGGDVPTVDYEPFDRLTVDGQVCVCDAISWSADENGDAEWTPEFLDPITTAGERNDLALRRMALGTIGGRSQSASPSGSDVDGLSTGKLPKYRDLKFNFSATATVRITGFSELKERRRLTNYLVTAQPQPDDSTIGPVSGPTTVNMYTADGTLIAFAVLPTLPNWSDDGEPSYRVEVRLGGGFFQEQTKFFCGIPTSGGHYNTVVEVASTDPL